jgi:hypothetical protein
MFHAEQQTNAPKARIERDIVNCAALSLAAIDSRLRDNKFRSYRRCYVCNATVALIVVSKCQRSCTGMRPQRESECYNNS